MAAQVPPLSEMLPHFESAHPGFDRVAFLNAFARGEAVTHIVDDTLLLGVAYCGVLRARKKVKGWRILVITVDSSVTQTVVDAMLEELLPRVSSLSLYVPNQCVEMVGKKAATVRLMRNVPKPARAPILNEMGMSVPSTCENGLAMMDLMVKIIPVRPPVVLIPETASHNCAAVPRDVHHNFDDYVVQAGAK